MEKEELQSALEEAESALEQEEAKVSRAQLEIASFRQEIDRRIAEKEEEFENTRRNHQRSLDSMNASLEAEAKGKQEALRIRKKLEQDINELEVALDGANRARAETEKNCKRLQDTCKELGGHIEEEQRNTQEARDAYNMAERRVAVVQGECDELRGALESAERGRKAAENELIDTNDRVNELSAQVQSLGSQKRKLEGDITAMQGDLEEMNNEVRGADDRAKKAVADAGRLADELRAEQEHGSQVEKMRKALEAQIKDLTVRLEEAESQALKGGKKLITKMEGRVSTAYFICNISLSFDWVWQADIFRSNSSEKNSLKIFRLKVVVMRLKTLILSLPTDPWTWDRVGCRAETSCRDPEEHAQGWPPSQGTGLPSWRGQEEPGTPAGPHRQTAEQDQDIQTPGWGGCKYLWRFLSIVLSFETMMLKTLQVKKWSIYLFLQRKI